MLFKPLRLSWSVHLSEQIGIVFQSDGGVGMVRGERLLIDGQGALEERMVGGEIALPTANSEPDVKVVPSSGSSVYSHL